MDNRNIETILEVLADKINSESYWRKEAEKNYRELKEQFEAVNAELEEARNIIKTLVEEQK